MTATLTVVGLGSGDENQLTLGALKALRAERPLVLRTERHPVCAWLQAEGVRYDTFDAVYEANPTFEATYEAIVQQLVARAEAGESLTYAVPGHPSVAEATVRALLREAEERGFRVELVGGDSFLDQVFMRLGFDPIEGFQLLDAADINAEALRPTMHTVIAQVYDRHVASEVKLALMELYPDEHPVVAAHELGVAGRETIERLPLYELDRSERFGNMSIVWIPRSGDERLQLRSFGKLHDIIRVLRSPEGCPWDREQTHESIRGNFIEETYEALEALDSGDPDAMREELGDVLLQIMLHAQMEEEAGMFTARDIIAGLSDKLIRRHPHVFGERRAANADEALEVWREAKRAEKDDAAETSLLDGAAHGMPALPAAWKLQKKAAKVGFDWTRMEDVLAKVEEEINEMRQLIGGEAGGTEDDADSVDARKEEAGDLLFAAVNAARFWGIDPEAALAAANRKFTNRFQYIERELKRAGIPLEQAGLDEMERLWREAKRPAGSR